MMKLILFLDANFLIDIFGRSDFSPETGQKILKSLAQKYDLRTTSTVLDEVGGSQIPVNRVIDRDWLSNVAKSATSDFPADVHNAGEDSLMSVIKPTGSNYDPSLAGREVIIASRDGSYTDSLFQDLRSSTQSIMEDSLLKGTVPLEDYRAFERINGSGLGGEPIGSAEDITASRLRALGEDAEVDAPGNLKISGQTTDLENIFRSGSTSASDSLGLTGDAATSAEEGFARLSRFLSEDGGQVLTETAGKLFVAAVIGYDVQQSIARALEKYNNGDYEGAGAELGALIGRTALGLAPLAAAEILGLTLPEVLIASVLLSELGDALGGAMGDFLGGATGGDGDGLMNAARNALQHLAHDLLDGARKSSAFFAGLEHLFSDATAQLSPLVLDLDGNGYDLSARSDTASTYFDLGTDGSAESTGWVAGGDGLLAIDSNHNGTIDNGAELFGDQTGYANGFEALKALDTDSNGKLDTADARFKDLRVWVDDGDGVTEVGELHTLTDLGITSIDLGYTAANTNVNGNTVKWTSSFDMNGATRNIGDAYFSADKSNSEWTGIYTLDPESLLLPQARGYGLFCLISLSR
jgi:hypothetical protein